MSLVSSLLIIEHHLGYHLVSTCFHDPRHHIIVVSRLSIEVGLGLASFAAWLNIHKEREIRDAKHLGELRGFPTIDFYDVYLFWAVPLIKIVINLVEVRHESIAVLTVRREIVYNKMFFVFASLL